MKKFILVSCLLFFISKSFSQQFSQYNTGTLFDSFENPSQRSFIPDSSKQIAFNLFVPNFGANFFLTGDVQTTLVTRAFGGYYNNKALQIGNGSYNHASMNANAYSVMFKIFTSLNGDQEIGFFTDTKADGRGAFTDESVALLNGPAAFPNNIYDDIFNNHYSYQLYNSFGFSYREKLSKNVAFGFKVSALLGVAYSKVDIDESHITFDKTNDLGIISLRGRYSLSIDPGKKTIRDLLPTFRDPGAAISMGASYKSDGGVTFQGNIKDLGFIHWYSSSIHGNFNGSATIAGLSTKDREGSIYKTVASIIKAGTNSSFNSFTDGKAEYSMTKSYWLDDQKLIKYSPTLIASKELFYSGYVGALVNHFQYEDYNLSLTASYDNNKIFNFGTQLMIKSPNAEFYIGSERLLQSIGLVRANNNYASYSNPQSTAADFFLGFSFKFGHLIEHPMNASYIPTGEKGFFGKLYERIFKSRN